jgi:aminoglycoside phosphotransferase (APT) family kinase protein
VGEAPDIPSSSLRPVGTGRSADVFEHGDGQVLRRYRTPRDTEREVAAMEHARAHGYPAPAARALNETDIVMERLAGPTMLVDMMQRPWRIRRHAATLALLLDGLHAIPAPGWLPAPVGDGEALLHLDLHPQNVILTERGPVVIDWPNVARGPGAVDVAHSWIVVACSLPPNDALTRAVTLAGRRVFLALFLRHFPRAELRAHLPAAAEYRLAIRTLPDGEPESIKRLLARNGPKKGP